MGTISLSAHIIGVALLLVTGVMIYVLRRRKAAKPTSLEEKSAGRGRRTIRILRIMAIGFAGLSLLFLAHLWLKDKESVSFLLAHEIGFALIVSLVVWALFEAQLSHEAEATWDQRIERVTKNVFQAVLRKDLPKALLDEANNLILNSSLIRDSFTVTYTLRDAQFESGSEGTVDCVLVEAVMEFTMRNVSTEDHSWPVKLSLPNPVHAGMKCLVAVRDVSVSKGGETVTLDLEAARKEFETLLQDNTQTAVPFIAGDVMLRPGESCHLSASYVMAKEAEDTELLSTLYPADGLRITLFDLAGDTKRVKFARSVHRQPVETLSSGEDGSGAKIFRLPGYLLPHQGVLIWWKKRPSAPTGSECVENAHLGSDPEPGA